MSAEPAVASHQQMFDALLAVTGWRIPAVSASRIGKLARDLLASGVLPVDLGAGLLYSISV